MTAWSEDLSILQSTVQGSSFDAHGVFASEPIPEPSTLFLLGSGLVGLIGLARKRFQKGVRGQNSVRVKVRGLLVSLRY